MTTTSATRRKKGKNKKLEGRSKLALGTTPRGPNGGYNQRSSIYPSEEAHPPPMPQGKSKETQTRPDTEMILCQTQYEAAKQKRGEKNQGMLKGEGSEGKQPKSGKEKNPKKGSFAFACVHCGKNNYKYPQEVEISSGESSDMNTDEEADSIDDGGNDRRQPYMPEEVDPFMENIYHAKLPRKTRISDSVQPYDGSEYPADHIRVFQTVARANNWDTATQCHMFKHTHRGAAKVWFEHLPKESINGFPKLRDAFLESFLGMKRHKGRDKKIRCTKRGTDESIENFTRRFLTESRRAKKMPEA
ncbi:retrotransposon gag domain-containing protein [Artemisia annua]|uniref:Retrotransposon gag domain-containing protein n=1 Tax=Artemisia annua TaxID=35608 RepID=A0A2U1MFD9_ARTAN|nr:retrotransposon gag domain-containing protein [Artemisia annua]